MKPIEPKTGKYEVNYDNCLESETTKWVEVDPVKEANMEKKDKPAVAKDINVPSKPAKPRLAEVLGVEVGQKWRVVCPEEGINSVEVWLNEKGRLIGLNGVVGSILLCAAINHPESIIRAPRLTGAELERCRVYRAKWVSRDKNCDDGTVDVWSERPLYGEDMYNQTEEGSLIATIHDPTLFPSVHPGDCICVEVGGK